MLAVCGGKGGVGKTTVALGLGNALAEQHRSSLLVETDTEMPDLHAVAEIPAEPGVDALACGAPLRRASHEAGGDGLAVVPATPGADVTGALRRLTPEKGVLLDCPAGGGRTAATPLRAADRAVVVTTRRRAAVRDAVKTVTMARELDARVVGVVLTRTEKTAGVGDAFEVPVLGCVPEVSAPLADHDATASYRRLVSRIRTA